MYVCDMYVVYGVVHRAGPGPYENDEICYGGKIFFWLKYVQREVKKG